eukprot:2045867-Pleurochrysis_carterae.AAC.1
MKQPRATLKTIYPPTGTPTYPPFITHKPVWTCVVDKTEARADLAHRNRSGSNLGMSTCTCERGRRWAGRSTNECTGGYVVSEGEGG